MGERESTEPSGRPAGASVPERARRAPRRRRIGTALLVAGALLLAYAAATLFWRDPVTDLYARYQQHRLDGQLEASFRAFREQVGPAPAEAVSSSAVAERRAVAAAARALQDGLEGGEPLGRLRISRLDLDTVFVHGTSWSRDLSRGPGHYEQTALPGLGETVAIAGHRTTFGAPFRHIDELERDDEIVLELAYGTFHYRVRTHEIVEDDDWSVIRDRGHETLVLSACHPLYSASHRWIVYARLVEVEPAGGEPYRVV